MNTKKTHHHWSMHLKLIGHNMPLIRILLILRKFRVGLESFTIDRHNKIHWSGKFLLDFELSTRTDTVFKKIARLYDVENLSYSPGTKLGPKTITLK